MYRIQEQTIEYLRQSAKAIRAYAIGGLTGSCSYTYLCSSQGRACHQVQHGQTGPR